MVELQIEPAVAAGLERLGWRGDEAGVRDVIPAILRGSNVVAVLPPGPQWATPILAGLVGSPAAASGALLVLASPAQLGEWATTLGALLEATGRQVDVLRELGDSTATGSLAPADVVLASPETALDRHSRSGLHPERFRAILFGWPEEWQADEAIAALLQDLPRDAQRVVLTSSRDRLEGAEGVIERYARKAFVPAVATGESAAPGGQTLSVRTIATPWAARATAVAGVVAAFDGRQVTIWTADPRDHQLIHRALGSLRPGVAIVARSMPAAGSVVCYDVPTAAQLAQLSTVGEVVLLVPPGCEGYVARIAPSRRPMTLESAASGVHARDAVLRQAVIRAVDSGDHAAALYALAPLFESRDPQLVAAALFGLWQGRPVAAASPAAPPPPPPPPVATRGHSPMAKIWIGAGKKDDATVADFVAVLVREVGMERGRIGRIELQDTFALVEVPATDAEAIAERLSGITIRKRKLTARVDQGRGGDKGPKARARPRS